MSHTCLGKVWGVASFRRIANSSRLLSRASRAARGGDRVREGGGVTGTWDREGDCLLGQLLFLSLEVGQPQQVTGDVED